MCSIRDEVHITKGNCIMTDTIINVSSLSFGYAGSDVLVLEDITFDIKKGEVALIIGASGSGKTTLLKMLGKSMIPEGRLSGKAEYYGRQISSLSQAEAAVKIGYVGQNPDNQIVATMVEEDVAFGPENMQVPTAEIWKRVERALGSVNMTRFRHKSPLKLSGGQKQRVAIAGIIAMEPKCIVLDEPTAMLDPVGRNEVIDTLHSLNEEKGITIILITHHMNEAIKADRVFVMDKGKLVMQGNPKEVFSHVEKLKSLGLEVPQVTELAYMLKKSGLNIEDGILTVEELMMQINENR